MRVVAGDLEVVETIIEDRRGLALDVQLRQRFQVARQLQVRLRHVVRIQVTVAAGPDEVADFKTCLLRHHVRQQGVGRNIERFCHIVVILHFCTHRDFALSKCENFTSDSNRSRC
jgi:hypothetical protein